MAIKENYIKNKRILKKIKDLRMAFGIEIEGAFTWDLYNELKERGSFKYDGSVLNPISIAEQWDIDSDDVVEFEEWSSDIVEYEELISILERLNKENGYFYDKENWSSGLHLHLSLSTQSTQLFLLASDWEKFKELQSWIKKEYKERIEKSRYCKSYTTKRNFSLALYNNTKYKVMRFHPQGTLEFRFLYPDERKIENVNKTIEFVVSKMFVKESKSFLAFCDLKKIKKGREYNFFI